MSREVLQEVLKGLYEAKSEAQLAQWNLYAMRDSPEYANVEGVSVLLTEIQPRLQAAYEAIQEALHIPKG